MPVAVQKALAAPFEERALVGKPDHVIERLQRDCDRLEIDLLIVRPQLARMETGPLERSLTILAEEVWPAVCSGRTADARRKS